MKKVVIAGGMDANLVIYPIGPGSPPGHALTNWAVSIRPREQVNRR